MSLNHRPKKAHYYDIYDTTYATKQEGQPHNFVKEWNRIKQMTTGKYKCKKRKRERVQSRIYGKALVVYRHSDSFMT
jgi:hypothetical protein